ncbi:MAG: OFA family MFS transporter [Clostridiales bacterium]|nr:OFA family MFS transporter [Clostridiales bacterium]
MKKQSKLNKWIVLWSAIGVSVVLGILYVWSVISKGLQDELHWTNTQASLPYTVFTVCMALGFFASGRIQDRLGPRICVIACAILMGVGLAFSGIFTTPWLVMAGFGIICGVGVGAGNAASLAPSLKWFPSSKKGMVSGAVLAGIGLSAAIYSPFANFLLGAVGVSNSFLIFSAISFAGIFILSFNMYDPPQGYDKEKGMVLPGAGADTAGAIESGQPKAGSDEGAGVKAAVSENDVATKDMLRTRSFYLIFIIFAVSSASGLMIIAHVAKIAQVQASWEGGFILVIVLNLFNTAGRFIGGMLSDRIGRVNTLMLILSAQALNMVFFRLYADVPQMAVGIMVQGFCYGTIFAVMPALTSDLFGLKSFGSNYGTIFLAWGIGGIIGPMTGARVYDTTGAYYMAYLIACVLSLASLTLVLVLRREKKRLKR